MSAIPELDVFDELPLSFWMSSGKEDGYRIAAWNKGAQDIYGYTAEKALGTSYLDLFVEEAARPQSMADADALIAGNYKHPINCLAIDRNSLGQEVILLTNVFRYEHQGRAFQAEIAVNLTPSGFLNFLDDDYRAKRVGPDHVKQRTLAAFIEHYLAAFERNRQQWTRTFAHEIRAHLAVMNNALSELSEDQPGILEKPGYGEIAHSTRQLWLLSENFLLSQKKQFRIRDNSDGGALGETLMEVADEYAYSAAAKGITIQMNITAEVGRTPLYGTFEAFRHTIRILVSNALKHTDLDLLELEKEHTIVVSARKRQSAIVIGVANVAHLDAPLEFDGMEPDLELRGSEGLHLGLTIAKQWVNAVGGTIKVAPIDASHVIAEVVWPLTHSERKERA